ncbi:MAG: uracil-DNA glycosylase [Anaerolineaceae bacterium]|nr:uracil-DNA glycosylase [Anaerolineaceae bacterium]
MLWKDIIDPPMVMLGHHLADKAKFERRKHEIFPPQNQIFRALSLTQPETIKAVIVGQDPYHTPGAANGLAFSINQGLPIQPSLQNIFKELHSDIGCDIPQSGDLTNWAKQGVLLLNRTLTVEAHKPNSHADWGWQLFTKHIFDLCVDFPQPIVFILWGKYAQELADGVDWATKSKKMLIKSPHPSPFSANKGFFGSSPFSRTNSFLSSNNVKTIDWTLF